LLVFQTIILDIYANVTISQNGRFLDDLTILFQLQRLYSVNMEHVGTSKEMATAYFMALSRPCPGETEKGIAKTKSG
jgi:hypothetical protein